MNHLKLFLLSRIIFEEKTSFSFSFPINTKSSIDINSGGFIKSEHERRNIDINKK